MPIHSVHQSIDPPESIHIIIFEDRRQWSPGPLISPSETTLPYAYTLLAPSNAVEERVCISVLVALVVVLVVASALAGSSRVERVVAADVVADMSPLAETARSQQGRDAGVLERTSGAADDEMGFLSADGFPWSNAMLQCSALGSISSPRTGRTVHETKLRPRPGARRPWTRDFLNVNFDSLSLRKFLAPLCC